MIKQLNVLKQAITQKPLVNILSFIHVYSDTHSNRVQANNGSLCIDTQTDFPEHGNFKASKIKQALLLCGPNAKFNITPTGRLSIKSNKFKALIEASQELYPTITLDQNKQIPLAEDIPALCRLLIPFISQDASRAWSKSILIQNKHAYVTNNVMMLRIPVDMQDCVIPLNAVETLALLDEQPLCMSIGDNYISFSFNDGTWIRAASIDVGWPEVESIINKTETVLIPENFNKYVLELIPFCEDPKFPVIYLNEEGLTTNAEGFGASYEMGSLKDSKFRAESLLLLSSVATHVDFSSYPSKCYFKGHNGVEGVIMGLS